MRLEHRDIPCEWVAAVWHDGWTCSVSVQDMEHVRLSAAPDTGLWWILIDRAGRIVRHGTHWPCIPDADTLRRVEAAGADLVQAAQPMFADRELPVYIRFGELPRGGRSRNWATGEFEPGVSCYRARRRVDGGYMLSGPGLPYAAIDAAIRGDVALLITGEECGRGSDGEPCLQRPKVLTRLQYDAKKSRFVETAR